MFLTYFLLVKIVASYKSTQADIDYKNLELGIKECDIDYYTVYHKDSTSEYKIYKINNTNDSGNGSSIEKIKSKLKNNNKWSKEKFYKYIMQQFYGKTDGKITDIDKEDLYYYNDGLIYAIIDVKMLYYIILFKN